jgi:RNA polymerase sigma-70 factor (ECF subfamily)
MDEVEGKIREALRRGDHRAAATVAFEAYVPQLRTFVVGILRSESDGNEVFSQVCEEIWRGLPGFRGDGSFRAWAYRIAWCGAIRWKTDPFRRRGRRLLTSEISQLVDASSKRWVDRSTGVEGRARALEALRARLEPEEQALLTLRLDREMAWEEVAAVLAGDGQPASAPALRKRFERLKEKLGRLAREQGLIPARRDGAPPSKERRGPGDDGRPRGPRGR